MSSLNVCDLENANDVAGLVTGLSQGIGVIPKSDLVLGKAEETGQGVGELDRQEPPDPAGKYNILVYNDDILFNFNTHFSGCNTDPTKDNCRVTLFAPSA